MPLLFIFIIWYNCYGRNNPKIYRELSDKIPKIIGALIIFSVISSALPSVLSFSIFTIVGLSVGFGPLLFIIWLIRKALGKDKARDRKADYTYYQNHYQEQSKPKATGTAVTGLTRSVPKRRRIVEKFNKKYSLSLTEKEIDRIVDASYMSNCWEREIYDMNREYDSVFQWYNGDSGWLRSYLHAFPVQSVSSDFELQRTICLDSFDQIFRDINPGDYTTIDDCIDAINQRYLTAFDDSTFMIAYRFLEANGRHYELPHLGVMRNESDIDRLKHKYDATPDAEKNTAPTSGTARTGI